METFISEVDFIDESDRSNNFNPFLKPNHTPSNQYSEIAWRKFLNSLSYLDLHGGLRLGDCDLLSDDTTIFYFVLTHCDFPTIPSAIITALIETKSTENPQLYWNPSMQELFDLVYQNEHPEWDSNSKTSFADLLLADAGNSFVDEPWVIPWFNFQKNTYSDVRGSDKIEGVLKDSNKLQYTNANYFELPEQEESLEFSKYYLGNNILTFSNEQGTDFNKLVNEDGVITFSEADDGSVAGLYINNNTVQFLTTEQIQQLAKRKDKWIRLLMPKYLRSVEVEDLNRNFWVIGQVLSQLLYYLFDPEGVLCKTLKGLAEEIEEMWNNIEYLWAMTLCSDRQDLPDSITWHVEVVVLNEYAKEYGVDYNEPKNLNRNDVLKRLEYLKHQYINQNLAIIPYVRKDFYEQNHYSSVCFPGLAILQRFVKENDVIAATGKEDFEWYAGIEEQSFDFEQIAKKNNIGSGIYDDGHIFEYCTLNYAKLEDKKYYSAFRPKITIQTKTLNNEWLNYDFDSDNGSIANNLKLSVDWEDAIYKAVKGTVSEENKLISDTFSTTYNLKTGFYLGELVSQKVPRGKVQIISKEVRLAMSGKNSSSQQTFPLDIMEGEKIIEKKIDGGKFNIYYDVENGTSHWEKMCQDWQQIVKTLADGVYKNLLNDSSYSNWIFRLGTSEFYSDALSNYFENKPLGLEAEIENEKTIMRTLKANGTFNFGDDKKYGKKHFLNKETEFYGDSIGQEALHLLNTNGKIYTIDTSKQGGENSSDIDSYLGLANRYNAALRTPYGLITYNCKIATSVGGSEHKHFLVVSKNEYITKDNWAVLFVYGRYQGEHHSNTNPEIPKENLITIFYGTETGNGEGQCESIRFLKNGNDWEISHSNEIGTSEPDSHPPCPYIKNRQIYPWNTFSLSSTYWYEKGFDNTRLYLWTEDAKENGVWKDYFYSETFSIFSQKLYDAE